MKKKQVLAGVLSALMVITMAVPVQAASKKSVYVVTKETDVNNGGTWTYKYNKNGLISQATYTETTKDVSKSPVYEYYSSKTGETGASGDANHTVSYQYDIYGTKTSTTQNTSKETYKYTYNTKGKAKGKLSKVTYSATKTSVVNETYATNCPSYDAAYSGGYTYVYKDDNRTTTYTYDKKGRIKQKVTVDTDTPSDKTYSKLSGYYQSPVINYTYTDASGVNHSVNELNGSNYLKYTIANPSDDGDKDVYTTTVNYTTNKKGLVTKAVSQITLVSTDIVKPYEYDDGVTSTYDEETDEYIYTVTGAPQYVAITDSSWSSEEDVSTRVYNTDTTTYKYNKKGYATKVVSKTDYGYKYSGEDKIYNTDGTVSKNINDERTEEGKKDTYTYTYKYDKNKNLKSEVIKSERGTLDEKGYVLHYGYTDPADPLSYHYGYYTYDNYTVSNTYKQTIKFESEVKKGTTMLTQSTEVSGAELNTAGDKDSSKTLARYNYKLKKKKLNSTYAKLAEKQQYIIQNEQLNGEFGLNQYFGHLD